mmetsp:Transcript_49389/g.120539  ORF Transcript_49389/g.120539 Transcript_49389/m.120539 type:complete len:638 (-) Transcript_49389:911-2824(-)
MRVLVALLGAGALVALVAVSATLSSPPGRASLLGASQVFDSNVPVQWDAGARTEGTSGLSRYFKSAGADLAKLPEAHTFQLAQVSSSFARHQQLHSKDWDESKWSKEHRRNVGLGIVDKDSAKGIWHSGGEHAEAWDGIDKIFPTDTQYAFEEDHIGKGESAKMRAYVGHVANQLRLMELELEKQGQGAGAQRLRSVLEAGQSALSKIQQGGVQEKAVVPQLRQVKAGRERSGLRAHYLSSESARNDISSYFKSIESATEKENRDNTRACGESDSAPLPLHQLRAIPSQEAEQQDLTAKAFASEFASKLAEGIQGSPDAAQRSDSCQLCVKIFGCMDCCEPVCKKEKETPTTARKEARAPIKASARGAPTRVNADAQALAKKAAEMMKVLVERSMQKTLKASSETSKEPSLSRMPCECKSDECKECPGDENARQRYSGKLSRARRALREAERAVAKTNDILVERVAALHATNAMAMKQELGSYGPESDDEVWPAREPTPGKSEQVASGASDVIRGLIEEVDLAQQKAHALRQRMETAERAAQYGAEVTAEQRHLIRELSEQLEEQAGTAGKVISVYDAAGLSRYGGERAEKLATRSVLPFYEQPGEGGAGVRAAVKFFEEHPMQVKADIGGHPIISS